MNKSVLNHHQQQHELSHHDQQKQQNIFYSFQKIFNDKRNIKPCLAQNFHSTLRYFCSNPIKENSLHAKNIEVHSEKLNHLLRKKYVYQGKKHCISASNDNFDIKLMEIILIADIETVLAKLQEIFGQINLERFIKHNADLDSSKKEFLLQLFLSFIAKLKVFNPEDDKYNKLKVQLIKKRFQSNHSEKSMSPEEVALAKRWVLENKFYFNKSSESFGFKKYAAIELKVQKLLSSTFWAEKKILQTKEKKKNSRKKIYSSENVTYKTKFLKKNMNQKKSTQFDNERRFGLNENTSSAMQNSISQCQDYTVIDNCQKSLAALFQINKPVKVNKFPAKKLKIKRVNTIDAPNISESKMKTINQYFNGLNNLNCSINVFYNVMKNHKKAVPLFELKTDNDYKFLASLRKNSHNTYSESFFNSIDHQEPFCENKKKWSDRFSITKTSFYYLPRNDIGDKDSEKVNDVKLIENFEKKKNTLVDESSFNNNSKISHTSSKKEQSESFDDKTASYSKIKQFSSGPKFMPTLNSKSNSKHKNLFGTKIESFYQHRSLIHLPSENDLSLNPEMKIEKNPVTGNAQPAVKNTLTRKQLKQYEIIDASNSNYYSFCKDFRPFFSGKSDPLGRSSNIASTVSKLLNSCSGQEPEDIINKKMLPSPSLYLNRSFKKFCNRKNCVSNFKSSTDPNKKTDHEFSQKMSSESNKIKIKNNFSHDCVCQALEKTKTLLTGNKKDKNVRLRTQKIKPEFFSMLNDEQLLRSQKMNIENKLQAIDESTKHCSRDTSTILVKSTQSQKIAGKCVSTKPIDTAKSLTSFELRHTKPYSPNEPTIDHKFIDLEALSEVSTDNLQHENLHYPVVNHSSYLLKKWQKRRSFNLIGNQVFSFENQHSFSSSMNCDKNNGLSSSLDALKKNCKAQEKIDLFESKVLKSKNCSQPSISYNQSRKNVDNKNRISKNSVLARSESFHQISTKKDTQEIQQSSKWFTELKPSKLKVHSQFQLTKQFEALITPENARKKEKQIKRYFEQPLSKSYTSNLRQMLEKNQAVFSCLMRSNTMPQLSEKKFLDENFDIEQAFENIFNETNYSNDYSTH